MRTTYEASAVREGDAWVITLPELGVSGKTERLTKADAVARALLTDVLGVGAEEAEVLIKPVLDPLVRGALDEAEVLAREGDALTRRAAKMRSEAVRAYVQRQGLTVREAAIVLGMSYQRVQQLVKG